MPGTAMLSPTVRLGTTDFLRDTDITADELTGKAPESQQQSKKNESKLRKSPAAY